jgi:hypothetical protein
MKHVMIALPAAIFLAGATLAQTDTTTGTAATTPAPEAGAATGMFGTNWPLSVGTTFFSGPHSAALRSTEEITSGWQSLSPDDQTMIRADCEAFTAAHGGTSTEATGTDTATSPTTGGDAAATGTAPVEPAGYDLAEMQAICGAVAKL